MDDSQPVGAAGAAQIDREILARAAGLPLDAVEIVAEIDSTNRELMRRPGELPGGVLVLLAFRQVAGRGRRGRQWLSDPRKSLTFSVAYEHRRHPATPPLSGLSLAYGVALAETVSAYVEGIGLKWPNDLIRAGRKCAGMLVETRLSGDRERIVVGTGVNLELSPEIEQSVEQAIGGVFDPGVARPSSAEIAGRITRAYLDATDAFLGAGFPDLQARWARFDVLAGRRVRILEGGKVTLDGVADGLAAGGELRVLGPDGVVEVAVGEVSARLADAFVERGPR